MVCRMKATSVTQPYQDYWYAPSGPYRLIDSSLLSIRESEFSLSNCYLLYSLSSAGNLCGFVFQIPIHMVWILDYSLTTLVFYRRHCSTDTKFVVLYVRSSMPAPPTGWKVTKYGYRLFVMSGSGSVMWLCSTLGGVAILITRLISCNYNM